MTKLKANINFSQYLKKKYPYDIQKEITLIYIKKGEYDAQSAKIHYNWAINEDMKEYNKMCSKNNRKPIFQ